MNHVEAIMLLVCNGILQETTTSQKTFTFLERPDKSLNKSINKSNVYVMGMQVKPTDYRILQCIKVTEAASVFNLLCDIPSWLGWVSTEDRDRLGGSWPE